MIKPANGHERRLPCYSTRNIHEVNCFKRNGQNKKKQWFAITCVLAIK